MLQPKRILPFWYKKINKNYELHNGDCLEIMKNIPNKSIKLVLTDPPYLFNKGHGNKIGSEGEKSKFAKTDMYDVNGIVQKSMGGFGKHQIYKLLDESKRVCKKMRGYYFCNETALQYYLSWATENKCKYNIIVLKKQPFIMNRNRYSTNCEYIVRIFAKVGAGINVLDYNKDENNIEWLYSVQDLEKIKKCDKLHLTQKPLSIINGIIKLNTNLGDKDIVLDPFMGSGSTGVSCMNTNRRFIGIELDKNYFEIAKNRIEKACK